MQELQTENEYILRAVGRLEERILLLERNVGSRNDEDFSGINDLDSNQEIFASPEKLSVIDGISERDVEESRKKKIVIR